MAFSLLWLPDVLGSAGLKVAPVDGWQIRGRGDMGPVLGVLCHHTAGPRNGNMPSLDVLIHGRPGLNGPLAQLGLGRDGTWYVIAAGRCNHAGAGSWNGITAGNTHFMGVEAEHTGLAADEWPPVQMNAYQRGVAAILKHAGLEVDRCAGHKEFAPGRKIDPAFDMNAFRAGVAAFLTGAAPAPVLIPAEEPPSQPGGATGRPTLRRGDSGPLVREAQAKIGARADGVFGARTEAAVRAFQRARTLVPDGIIGPQTWAALDSVAAEAPAAAAAPRAIAAPGTPWPDTLASKMLAAWLHLKFGIAPGDLMQRNPPMAQMPFFNAAASEEIRRTELGLVAGGMLRFLAELSIAFEDGSSLEQAHADLVNAMLHELAPSSGMSDAINNHHRFRDEP
jgi:hypothetical protein